MIKTQYIIEASSDEYLLMHDLRNGMFLINIHFAFMRGKDSRVLLRKRKRP